MLKVDRTQVNMSPDTPSDLIQLMFTTDASQLETIERSGHNPFDAQWKPPTQLAQPPQQQQQQQEGGPQSDYAIGGFFCMPCFHRLKGNLILL